MSADCTAALVMPKNYVIINEDEMMYLEGGTINLGMLNTFTNKSVCMLWAIKLIDHGSVKRMTYQQVAQEIYAHAYVYYNYRRLPSVIKNNSIAKKVYNSAADGICIEDGGDTKTRKAFYSLVWNVC